HRAKMARLRPFDLEPVIGGSKMSLADRACLWHVREASLPENGLFGQEQFQNMRARVDDEPARLADVIFDEFDCAERVIELDESRRARGASCRTLHSRDTGQAAVQVGVEVHDEHIASGLSKCTCRTITAGWTAS